MSRKKQAISDYKGPLNQILAMWSAQDPCKTFPVFKILLSFGQRQQNPMFSRGLIVALYAKETLAAP